MAVVVNEGTRYRWGELRITGDSSIDHDLLSQAILANVSQDDRDATSTKEAKRSWTSNSFADFTDDRLKKVHEHVASVFETLGYHFPEFEVMLDMDNAANLAHLQLDISHAGSQQPIGEIVIDGLTRHTRKQILEFLELPAELFATTQLTERIVSQLELTGRFVYVRAWTQPPFGPNHAVTLHVKLREYEKMPLLSEQLDERQLAALRLGRWIGELAETGDDFYVSLRMNPGDHEESEKVGNVLPEAIRPHSLHIEVWIAGSGGSILWVRAFGQDQRLLGDISQVLVADRPGLVDWQNRTKWIASHLPVGATTTVLLAGQEADADGRQFRMYFGGGLKGRPNSASDAAVPLEISVKANPAAIAGFLEADKNLHVESHDGFCRVSGTDGYFEVDVNSGRLRAFRFSVNGYEIDAEGGAGLLAEELARVRSRTADWPNTFREQQVLASLVGYCATTVQHVTAKTGDELPEAFQLLIKLLQDQSTTHEVAQVLTGILAEDNFSIPNQQANEAVSVTENVALNALKGMVPVGSTFHRLTNAVQHAKVSGDGVALIKLLEEFERDAVHGPLTCLAARYLVNGLRRPLAHMGLKRLEKQTELPAEIKSVLDGPCVAGNLLKRIVHFQQSLSAEETILLSKFIQQATVTATINSRDGEKTDYDMSDVRAIWNAVRGEAGADPDVAAEIWLSLVWRLRGREFVRQTFLKWSEKPKSAPSLIKPASHTKKTADKKKQPFKLQIQ